MNQPTDEQMSDAALIQVAKQVMEDAKFPFLATMDGEYPKVRPVSPVRVDGFVVYIANLRMYQKTRQIEANPHVELCYMSTHHDQVRISGLAERVTDSATLQSIWDSHPLLRKYLGTLDAVVPSHVQGFTLSFHDRCRRGGPRGRRNAGQAFARPLSNPTHEHSPSLGGSSHCR